LACACWLFAQRPAALDEAWRLAANGDRDGAMRLLAKLVQDGPKNADVRLLYGSLLSEAGNGSEAVSQLQEAVRLRPRSAEAQNALGEAYSRFGNEKAARDCFRNAVALKPDFATAHLNLGQALLAANESKAAEAHLDRAIALFGRDPDAADAYYLRAKIDTAQSDDAGAAKLLEKAVALRPNMAEAWSDLGQARKLLLDQRGALDALLRAVAADPNDAVAQYRLGAIYLDEDQYEPAIEHLSEASRINPADQSTLNALQLALRRARRAQEAEQVRERLATLLRNRDRTDQNALNAIKINNEGAKLEKAGDLRAACDKYRIALQLYPDHVGIRVNYAVVLLRLGQWTEGLTQLREAQRRDPENAKIKAALADALKQAPHVK
jgi:Flp pilus assembly protein TadD